MPMHAHTHTEGASKVHCIQSSGRICCSLCAPEIGAVQSEGEATATKPLPLTCSQSEPV